MQAAGKGTAKALVAAAKDTAKALAAAAREKVKAFRPLTLCGMEAAEIGRMEARGMATGQED